MVKQARAAKGTSQRMSFEKVAAIVTGAIEALAIAGFLIWDMFESVRTPLQLAAIAMTFMALVLLGVISRCYYKAFRSGSAKVRIEVGTQFWSVAIPWLFFLAIGGFISWYPDAIEYVRFLGTLTLGAMTLGASLAIVKANEVFKLAEVE